MVASGGGSGTVESGRRFTATVSLGKRFVLRSAWYYPQLFATFCNASRAKTLYLKNATTIVDPKVNWVELGMRNAFLDVQVTHFSTSE